MRTIFVSLLFFYSLTITSQSFGVSDTLKILSKTTDFGVMHDFIQLENYSGKDLAMRWKQTFSPGFPSAWIPSIQDPENWYNQCDTLDSADFVLPDSTTFTDKMVIGLDHQQMVGAGFIYYQLFPIDDPTDTINIAFSLNVSQGSGTTSLDETSHSQLEIFPNPITDKLWIRKPLGLGASFYGRLVHPNGQTYELNFIGNGDNLVLNCGELASGVYFLQLISDDKIWQQKMIIR